MAASGKLKKQSEPIEVEGVLMREVHRKSVAPVYGIAAVWILYALIFPLYRWFDFLIAAVASIAAYWILGRVFPGKTELVPEQQTPADTGDALADQMIAEGRGYLAELRRVNALIPDPALTGKIARMGEIAGRILDFVADNPRKAGSVRKFLNYYLPTMVELLLSYAKLDRQDVEGKNISGAMNEIERIMDMVIPAFEKQLDALFQDEALDASVDIQVLKSMLAQEGLTGSDFESKN